MLFTFAKNWGRIPRPIMHLSFAMILCATTAVLAYVFYFKAIENLNKSTQVVGVVVDSKVSKSGLHRPIIGYHSSSGEPLEFRASISSKPQRYFVGETVIVLLDPETQKPKLKNFFTLFGLPSFFAMFSFISLLGAIGTYHFRVRRKIAEFNP